MATLANLLLTVRELSFDNYPAMTLYIKAATPGIKLTITSTGIFFTTSADVAVESFLFSAHGTLQEMVDAIGNSDNFYQIAVSPTFIGREPSNSLRKVLNKDISTAPLGLSRNRYFSDKYIMEEIIYNYLIGVFQIRHTEVSETYSEYLTYVETFVTQLTKPLVTHMALWVAYHVVESRRTYEAAKRQLDVTGIFSDEDATLIENFENASSMSVTIGDVFSVTTGPEMVDLSDQIHLAGVDNVFGDKNSFWYRLQLFLRLRFEYLFSDFSLRKDQIIQGTIQLEKKMNGYAYFDTWPYTLSPVSREILQG